MRDELLNLLVLKAIGTLDAQGEARVEQILELQPELWSEYESWQAELPALKELAGIAGASTREEPAMPEHIREELLEHLKESFEPEEEVAPVTQSVEPATPNTHEVITREVTWRWAFVPAVCLVALFVISLKQMDHQPSPQPPARAVQPQPKPAEIQVALLDVIGQTRGTNDPISIQLQDAWPNTKLQNFSRSSEMREWRDRIPSSQSPFIKVLYNVSSGELTVTGHFGGVEGEIKTESFTLTDPKELPELIQKAQTTIKKWQDKKGV